MATCAVIFPGALASVIQVGWDEVAEVLMGLRKPRNA
jgi:hypothetical protein